MGLHIGQTRDAYNVRYGRTVMGLHIDQTRHAYNVRYGRSVMGLHIDQTRVSVYFRWKYLDCRKLIRVYKVHVNANTIHLRKCV